MLWVRKILSISILINDEITILNIEKINIKWNLYNLKF